LGRLKEKLLLALGGVCFAVGMVLFPLPVPFGLPVMIIGLAIMFKASNRVKRAIIHLSDKNPHTRKARHKARQYLRSKKTY